MKLSLIPTALAMTLISQMCPAQSWTPIGFSSPATVGAILPTIAFGNNGILYTAFTDFWDDKASAIQYDGSSWSALGPTGFSAGSIVFCGLGAPIAVTPDGTPYVAYADTGARNITVKKYNGSAWVTVGNPNFSNAGITGLGLVTDSIGTPYVVFNSGDTAAPGATVMKFDGSAWVLVGNPGFSSGYVNFPSIAIGPGGTPYVTYGDFLNGGKATVLKFNGSDWVNVGSPDFSEGFTLYNSIAISRLGTPYVTFQDAGITSSGSSVMKFDGSNWVNVGHAGLTIGGGTYTNIVIDSSGTPYVSYSDFANGQKASVMKFDGANWVFVGSPGFSAGAVNFNSLALDHNGTPYLAYTDTGTGNSVVMKFVSKTQINTIAASGIYMLSVLPLPNHGTFKIISSAPENEEATFIITNAAGQAVRQFSGSTNEEVQVYLNLRPGVYFVTSIIGQYKQSTQFIVL